MRPRRPDWITGSALVVLCCIFMGCGDERVAGTSTSIGTAIGGKVLLSNGLPGAGAQVYARSDTLVMRDGKLGCKLFDSTRSDGEGRFSLPRLPRGGFYLEIISSGSTSAESPEVYFEHVFIGSPADSSLGTLMTLVAGSLQGKAKRSPGASDSSAWIGIVGTDHFVKVSESDASQGAFRLDGLYPAEHYLTVVIGSGSGVPVMLKKQPIVVTSGGVVKIDLLY